MRKILLFLLILFAFSCSSSNDTIDTDGGNPNTGNNPNEGNNSNEEGELPFGLTVLTLIDGAENQIDIGKNRSVSNPINLTDQLGLPESSALNLTEDKITYSFFAPSPSFWSKNLNTGQILSQSSFCTEIDSMVGAYSITNSSRYHLYLTAVGDFTEDGWNTYVNIYDTTTDECNYVNLGFGYYDEVKAFNNVAIVMGPGEDTPFSEFYFIDLNTSELYATLSLDAAISAATVIGNLLYLFKSTNQYEIRNLDNLEIMETVNTSTLLHFPSRLFISNYFGDEIEFRVLYPQPSPIGFGPGIFDLDSRNPVVDSTLLFQVRDQLQSQIDGFDGGIYVYVVDLKSKTIVVGFSKINTSDPENKLGGLAFVDYDGNIFDFVDLDHIPRQILIRN